MQKQDLDATLGTARGAGATGAPAWGLSTLSATGRLVVVGTLMTATVLAWFATVTAMSGMAPTMPGHLPQAPGGSTGQLLDAVGMWVAMMAGMMLPSTVSMTVTFAGLSRRRTGAATAAKRTAVFVTGYLAVWCVSSTAAAVAQQLLSGAGRLHHGALEVGLVGLVLVAAGTYQITPIKQACLRRCRTPIGFLAAHWRDGAGGASVLGIRHGLWCLACCLPLMSVLFAVGVMSLAWMAALAAVVLAEKVLPRGGLFARATGIGLLVLGTWTWIPALPWAGA